MSRAPFRQPGRWLVVAAWSPELDRLRVGLARLPRAVRKRITLATVGVGLVDAAIGTAAALAQHKPDAVVLVGTAGVYGPHVKTFAVGTAAVCRKTCLLAHIVRKPEAFLPGIMPTEEKCSAELVRALQKAAALPSADVACPLAITATKKAAAIAEELSACALENLEAFAVARAAAQTHVPFAAVLGIANRVGPTGHAEWKDHGKPAAAAVCKAVLEFFARS